MNRIGVAIPVILLLASMKYIEHKAATSPSYKNSMRFRTSIKNSIVSAREQSVYEYPYIEASMPIMEVEYAQTVDAVNVPIQIEASYDANVSAESFDLQQEIVDSESKAVANETLVDVEIDETHIDFMLDKLKKLYLLKKLIVGNTKKNKNQDYILDDPYRQITTSSKEEDIFELPYQALTVVLPSEVISALEAGLMNTQKQKQEFVFASLSNNLLDAEIQANMVE